VPFYFNKLIIFSQKNKFKLSVFRNEILKSAAEACSLNLKIFNSTPLLQMKNPD